jgi:predicted nucleotidyltransferase component of viral defense system
MNVLDRQLIDKITKLQRNTGSDSSFFEKDWYTTQVLKAISKIDDSRFQLVFSGGTSLSKGYRLIQRFSEDIDFKVIETEPGLTRTDRRQFTQQIAAAIDSGLSYRAKRSMQI